MSGLAKHDAVFRLIAPLGPEARDVWMAFMEEIGQERAALRDVQSIIVDYSEGRLDPLVALGQIGLRILEASA